MHWINLASNSCGLDSSTGTGTDRYPKGASSNPTRINIFQLISSVRISSTYIQWTWSQPSGALPVNMRWIPKGSNFLVKGRKACFSLSSQNITMMFYGLAFFPDSCSLFPATTFPNSQLVMASGVCPFASKITAQPQWSMWLCFKKGTNFRTRA